VNILKIKTIAIVLVCFYGCRSHERTFPEITSITESVYASGTVKSESQYEVVSEINGILQAIHISEGDTVQIGDLLFTINNTSAQLETENAQLAIKLAEEEKANLRNLERELALARENHLQDSLSYERQKNLWEQNIGTRNEVDQRRLAFMNSKTNYQNLLNGLSKRRTEVAINLQQARNRLSIAKEQQDNFQIRSKINGKVFQIIPNEGESVTAFSPIALLGHPERFIVELQVDEVDIVRILPKQEIFISMDSYRDTVFRAEVSRISPMMDERTGTFTVDGIFKNPPPRMFPNLTLEANILIEKKDSTLVIPRDYLLDDGYVMISPDERVQVKTGIMDFENVEIIEGISPMQYIYKP
jgi:HlyD family secretion protein